MIRVYFLRDIEDLVEKSDIPCTFLRAGFFQEVGFSKILSMKYEFLH